MVDPDLKENHYEIYKRFSVDSKDLRVKEKRILIEIIKNEFLKPLPPDRKKLFKVLAKEIQSFIDIGPTYLIRK